jgi:hypothetical protein
VCPLGGRGLVLGGAKKGWGAIFSAGVSGDVQVSWELVVWGGCVGRAASCLHKGAMIMWAA